MLGRRHRPARVLELCRHVSWAQQKGESTARTQGPTGQRTVYITTAIDYANGAPHLGHALEKIQADCIVRYGRLRGERVHFVTGLDEHGQTIAQTAASAGVAPQAWVDEIAAAYSRALQSLGVSCDDFIRTTEPRHARAVEEVLRRIAQLHPGDIYEAACSGSYCGGCEVFKLPSDLVDGRCADHPTIDAEWVEEQGLFFRLSAYSARLRALYEAHPDFLVPDAAFDQIRNLAAGEIQDFAISRGPLPWGLPFPGAPGHTVHVWFDALVNYLSAIGFPEQGYEQFWPPDLQIVGPDIARFHAVLWPAMLMAAGLEPPRQIWVHGWLKTNGARFSKSAGVHVALSEAVERHGADALRYFLLATMPWQGDGEFSWERFDGFCSTGLAGNLGNLTSRALAMMIRCNEGRVPAADEDGALDQSHRAVLAGYGAAMSALHLSEGAIELDRLGSLANRHMDELLPYFPPGARSTAELDEQLAALHRALVRIAALAQPFMPGMATELYRMLGGRGSIAELRWDELAHPSTAGWQVVCGEPLLPDGGL